MPQGLIMRSGRCLNTSACEETLEPLPVLCTDLRDDTRTSWVEENKPTQDPHLLNLWEAHCRAELVANKQHTNLKLRSSLHRCRSPS